MNERVTTPPYPPHQMQMTPELQAMLHMMYEAHQRAERQNDTPLLDIMMKIAVAISTAGILWLVTSVADLQQQMSALNVKQSVAEHAIQRLNLMPDHAEDVQEEWRDLWMAMQEELTEQRLVQQSVEHRLERLEQNAYER